MCEEDPVQSNKAFPKSQKGQISLPFSHLTQKYDSLQINYNVILK